jgi:hypothetical protein
VVTFYPTGDTKGVECTAVTDATGKYKLKQVRGGDGAPAGDYKVVISRYLKKDGTPLGPNEMPATAEAVESLPKRYSNHDAATLTAKVLAAGGDIPFDLKSR